MAVDGVSLTVAALDDTSFAVALIPHTLAVTTLGARRSGDRVNLEMDVLGKYVRALLPSAGAAAEEARDSWDARACWSERREDAMREDGEAPRALPFVSIEEAIEEIRRGRMLVVVDDEDRENEGDLLMAADRANPEAINFMAKHGRGLICVPLTGERLDQLQVGMMVTREHRARWAPPSPSAWTPSAG